MLWAIRDTGEPTVRFMPVEFLADDEAAAYGRYAGTPQLFLDDEELKLVRRHRGDHIRAQHDPATEERGETWRSSRR